MKNALHMVAVLLLLGFIVPACGDPTPEEPVNKVRSTAQDITLPAEIQALRDRIKTNLEAVVRTAKQEGITAQQIRNSLFSTSWDDPAADRLAKMPLPIRKRMQQVRDDFVRHNRLVVAAHDEAEGRVTPKEVTP